MKQDGVMGPPYRICFVCLGNICRSPMAEAVFRSLAADAGLDGAVEVASAGTGSWHVGEDADPAARAALRERGYPIAHRARQFAAEWYADYDLVVALDHDNERALRRLAPDDAARAKVRLLRSFDPDSVARGELAVPDPYGGDARGFAHVLDLVEAACQGLLEEVRAEQAAG